MSRERSKLLPKTITGLEGTYKTIKDLVAHLDDHPEDLRVVSKDGTVKCLQYELIQTEKKTYHLLLYDPKTMENFTDDDVSFDGTFDVTPKIKQVKQLLTMMGKKYNVVRL